ncbi:hypothetical protein [Rhodopila sp.]|uniref:hypothetical protein n=1 Tax=Rhodopila sp. TaxID=2480087 RepID=UPI003D0FCDF5
MANSFAPPDPWLKQLLAAEWTDGIRTRPSRLVINADHVMIGGLVAPIGSLIDARPADQPGAVLSFDLLHDGWKVTRLHKYKPLIYYAAFGSEDIFACLRASIFSLLTHGRWRHDIAVLTSPDRVALVRQQLAPICPPQRLHVAPVTGEDLLDWCCARYRLNAFQALWSAQPLLYLDTDVICDRPIDELMLGLIGSNTINLRQEGRLDEGEATSAGHWFGWRLLAGDGVPFDPSSPGFSSGAIGFANAVMAQPHFDAILASTYGHARSTANRHYYEGYDQPFANYVLRKRRCFATDLLNRSLRIHRVAADHISMPAPRSATGLVHFTGGVGLAEPKRAAMENYLAALSP